MRIGAVGLHLDLYSTLTSYGTDRGLNYFGRMIRRLPVHSLHPRGCFYIICRPHTS